MKSSVVDVNVVPVAGNVPAAPSGVFLRENAADILGTFHRTSNPPRWNVILVLPISVPAARIKVKNLRPWLVTRTGAGLGLLPTEAIHQGKLIELLLGPKSHCLVNFQNVLIPGIERFFFLEG